MDGAIERAKIVVETTGIASILLRPQRCQNVRYRRHCWESLQGEQPWLGGSSYSWSDLATAVLLRRTPLTPLKVTGRDAGAFLRVLKLADVSTLQPGRHVDACLLTGQSTLTDLITIACCQEEWLLLCEDVLVSSASFGERRVMGM